MCTEIPVFFHMARETAGKNLTDAPQVFAQAKTEIFRKQ
jgi:hypothetical protein